MRRRLALVTASLASFVSLSARASDATHVSPGLITSIGTPSFARFGFGSELSFMRRPGSAPILGEGAYLQLQGWLPDPERTAEDQTRPSFQVSAGPELSFALLGIELGADFRGRADSDHASSLGVRAAPYLSFGYGYVSASLAWLPIALEGAASPQGVVTAMTIGLKWPILLSGRLEEKDLCPHC